MKPFDLRLLTYARGILPVLIWGTLLGVLRGLAILVWAWSIGHLIAWFAAPIMDFDWSVLNIGDVFDGLADRVERWALLAAIALVVRSGATWVMNVLAERGAATVKHQLRMRALKHIDELGPSWVAGESEADITLKLTRGLDALDNFFSQYLPQLLLTATVTPILVVALLWADLTSAITVIIVFPIIPMFMILIGLATQGAQDRQWSALGTLSKAYLDVIRGLPTLKLFRREERQVERIRTITEEYRSRTMKVLRVTFLSGFVLDLAGTFSVALVAVTVGTRLVDGEYPLSLALFVLLLVPEVFIPIRQVGAAFHASSEGLTAAGDVFHMLETTPEQTKQPSQKADLSPDGDGALLRLDRVQPTRQGEPVAAPVTLDVYAGEIVAIAGPSGVGKTSLLGAVLGITPANGSVRVAPFAWSGQQPGLLRGTVASNITLGSPASDEALVRRVLDDVGLLTVSPQDPLGTAGEGLSGGQSSRLALARALYRLHTTDAKLLLLDEPTASLDSATEVIIMRHLRALTNSGVGVLVVSHREGVLAGADRVIRMQERERV